MMPQYRATQTGPHFRHPIHPPVPQGFARSLTALRDATPERRNGADRPALVGEPGIHAVSDRTNRPWDRSTANGPGPRDEEDPAPSPDGVGANRGGAAGGQPWASIPFTRPLALAKSIRPA